MTDAQEINDKTCLDSTKLQRQESSSLSQQPKLAASESPASIFILHPLKKML